MASANKVNILGVFKRIYRDEYQWWVYHIAFKIHLISIDWSAQKEKNPIWILTSKIASVLTLYEKNHWFIFQGARKKCWPISIRYELSFNCFVSSFEPVIYRDFVIKIV